MKVRHMPIDPDHDIVYKEVAIHISQERETISIDTMNGVKFFDSVLDTMKYIDQNERQVIKQGYHEDYEKTKK